MYCMYVCNNVRVCVCLFVCLYVLYVCVNVYALLSGCTWALCEHLTSKTFGLTTERVDSRAILGTRKISMFSFNFLSAKEQSSILTTLDPFLKTFMFDSSVGVTFVTQYDVLPSIASHAWFFTKWFHKQFP